MAPPEYFRNIAYRFPVFQSRQVRIGAYFKKFNIDGNLGSFSSDSKITYRLHAGTGVNFNITYSTFMGVGVRYLWAKPSYGGQNIKLGGFIATVALGFRF